MTFSRATLRSGTQLNNGCGTFSMPKSVLIIGEEELKTGALLLRDMATKEQRNITEQELLRSSSEYEF